MLRMEPEAGLGLTTLRSKPEPKSRVGQLTDQATQVPHVTFDTYFCCSGPSDQIICDIMPIRTFCLTNYNDRTCQHLGKLPALR